MHLQGRLSDVRITTEKISRLNLGCGSHVEYEGWINCDYRPMKGSTDIVFDLQQPWPFPPDSIGEVYASHVLEHLQDHDAFFRELWRVLLEGEVAMLRVPFGGCRAAWSDPTHVRPWYPESFCSLQPGYGQAIHNLQYAEGLHAFDIRLIQVTLTDKMHWVRYPGIWNAFLRCADHLPNAFGEVIVYLTPLKSKVSLQLFSKEKRGNSALLQYIYRNKRGHFQGVAPAYKGWMVGMTTSASGGKL